VSPGFNFLTLLQRYFRWLRTESIQGSRSRGDLIMLSFCAGAGLACAVVLVVVAVQVISGASMSINHFGLGFLSDQNWAPNLSHFGAATALFGTAVSSALALLIATPLALGIALYLALMAPVKVRAVVGPLVEMLAAIPSVIVGLWGLIFLCPFLAQHVEPFLHSVLGFIPIFGSAQTTGFSLFAAGIVLAIMILPIIASLSRDLFLTVPIELQDGAAALGATRWEVIRGVVIPTTFSGVAASVVLGLGRALGEAIAVTAVVGDGSTIQKSLFAPGQTLSSRIANDFKDIVSPLHQSSLFFLAVILLIFAVLTNLLASWISGRFSPVRGLA
jgi:phosphate transport system permease protein